MNIETNDLCMLADIDLGEHFYFVGEESSDQMGDHPYCLCYEEIPNLNAEVLYVMNLYTSELTEVELISDDVEEDSESPQNEVPGARISVLPIQKLQEFYPPPPDRTTVEFSELKNGTFFEYEEDYFIKSDDETAFKFSDGTVYVFDPDAEVIIGNNYELRVT